MKVKLSLLLLVFVAAMAPAGFAQTGVAGHAEAGTSGGVDRG